MSLIRTVVPSESILLNRIKASFAAGMTDFLARTDERRIVVIKNRRYAITAIAVFVISMLTLFLVNSYLEGALLQLATMYLLGLVTMTLILSHRWYQNSKILSQELNLALVPIITSTFSRLVLYSYDPTHKVATKEILSESGILPEAKNVLSADDMYMFFEPYEIKMRKITFERKKPKFHLWKQSIASGTLIEATLNNNLSGQTFLATRGGKFMAGKGRFWRGLEGVLSPVTQLLGETKFMEAVTTNIIEAEAVLSTEFIASLKRWSNESDNSIRIVLKENKIYIFYFDKEESSKVATTTTEHKKLIEFSLTILRPMWRTLGLLEEVR